MQIKESIKEFYKRLDITFSIKGFEASLSKNEIIKRDEKGWVMINLIMNKMYDYTYSIDTKFKLRNNIIQSIRKSVDSYFNEDSFTISESPYSFDLSHYIGNNNWEDIRKMNIEGYSISGRVVDFENQQSVDYWFNGFEKFMNEVGYDFFNRFKNWNDYDDWFNLELLKNGKPSQCLEWNDSCVGLIAAKLNNNPRFEEIFNIWSNHFEKNNDTEALAELQSIKKFVDNHTCEELICLK